MNNQKKIGIGILGLGTRGVYFGGKMFDRREDCEIVALCDIKQEKIDAARKELNRDIPASTSVDEFLQIPGLDAVIIATPDHAHKENAVAVLNAKKHLYLEKPMAQTIEDCDEIIEAWKGSDTVFLVGLELRYCTLMKKMKELITAGEVGDIKIGTVIDNVAVGGNFYYHGERRKKEYIKSLILEKGTHSLDLANWLIDASPRKVFAFSNLSVFGGDESETLRCRDCDKKDSCHYYVDRKGFKMDYEATIRDMSDYCVYSKECDVPDNGLVLIDYDNDCRISYMECQFTPEYSREFMFVGTKGKIKGFYNNQQDFKITVLKRHSLKEDVYYPKKAEGGGGHGGGDAGIVEEFIAKLKEGKPLLSGVRGARDSAAIAIAAAKSEESGLPEEIPPLGDEWDFLER